MSPSEPPTDPYVPHYGALRSGFSHGCYAYLHTSPNFDTAIEVAEDGDADRFPDRRTTIPSYRAGFVLGFFQGCDRSEIGKHLEMHRAVVRDFGQAILELGLLTPEELNP